MAIRRAGRFTVLRTGSPEAGSLFEKNCPAYETAPPEKPPPEGKGLLFFIGDF